MDVGDLLTRWSVRLALALYVLSLILRWAAGGSQRLAWARLAWTAGFLAFLFHVVFAFQFYHHWSHVAAYEATARQTEDVVGLAWGGGIYANYAFVVLWGADVCWWWYRPQSYLARSRGIEWAVQGFLAFIAFNATVVFGTGAIRWVGLIVSLLLPAVVGYSCWRRNQSREVRS